MSVEVGLAQSNRAIFLAALDIADEHDRQAFLEQACAGDAERRRKIQRLLAAHHECAANPVDDAIKQLGPAETRGPEADASIEFDIASHRTIDRYKLLEQIGEGGMGAVFMAQQDEPIRRRVALKLIKAGMDSREVIARFQAERQALAMMDHPNIAHVLDAGTTAEGRPYFVMELVCGVPITDYCDTNRLSIDDRLRLFIDVCRAIQHAHQKGIIHRDLKPSNVMITLHDGAPVVKVIDFGVAKALNQELSERTLFTQFSQMVGTPLYMSPEQAEMSGLDIDTRSDVYSLGVLLYELLTGTTPFDKERLSKAGFDGMRRIIREEEPSRPSHKISTLEAHLLSTVSNRRKADPRQLSLSMRSELDWIAMKALEKDRNRRYESASAMASDIQRYLDDEPVQACPPSSLYRLRKLSRRYRGTVVAAVTVLVALMAGLGGTSWQAVRATNAERAVREESEKVQQKQQETALERDAALQNQYNTEIVSGQTDWERGYLQRLSRKLGGHLPVAGKRDRRGWEWYYLFSLCRPEVRTLYFPGSSLFVAWSPDGEYIGASGGIWRAQSGENVHRLVPSNNKRYRCAWSPDGQRFAWGTASDDNGVYVWDRQTDELRELRGHKSSVWCVNWSPDGKQLASGGIDGEAWIWNANTGVKIKAFDAGNFVTDVAWSPDGELLTAGVKKDQLKVWDTESGELVSHCTNLAGPGPDYGVQLSWHPDGEQLAVSTPQRWSVLRRSDWTAIRQHDMAQGRGSDIAWGPDGQRIAVADGETIFIWRPSGDVPEHTLRGHLRPVSAVAWSPDGQQLVSSGNTGEVKIWDVDSPIQPPAISTGAPIQSVSWAASRRQWSLR